MQSDRSPIFIAVKSSLFVSYTTRYDEFQKGSSVVEW